MRNILKYPVARREVIQVLETAAESLMKDGLVGGIDGAALDFASKVFRDMPEEEFKRLALKHGLHME